MIDVETLLRAKTLRYSSWLRATDYTEGHPVRLH